MDGREKGTIRILSVPNRKEQAVAVADYLIQIFKKAPREKPKVEALLGKAPVDLVSGVSRHIAEKIIARLKALGADAEFRPKQAATPVEAQRSEKATESSGSSIAPQRQPSPDERVSPSSDKEQSGKPQADKRKLALAAMVALLLAGVAYFWGQGGGRAPTGPSSGELASSAHSSRDPGIGAHFSARRIVDEFDKTHAPLFDKRLADGLAEAIREYARLFPSKNGSSNVKVDYSYIQEEVSKFRLTYNVKGEGGAFVVEAPLFTSSPRYQENIPTLAGALAEAVDKLGASVYRPDSLERAKGAPGKLALQAMERLDSLAVLLALSGIGQEVGPSRLDPAAFIESANLMSWMAYIKSVQETRKLPDMLGAMAVANHLLAALFIEAGNPDLAESRALVWMGLGYPAASISALAETPGAEGKLVFAVGKNDAAQVEKVGNGDKPLQKLAMYLSARMAREAGLDQEVDRRITEMLREHPDFMPGIGYAISHGTPDMARLAPTYGMEVSRRSLYAEEKLLDMAWVEKNPAMAATISGAHNAQTGMEEMLKLAVDILGKSEKLRGEERILTFDFCAQWLAEELKESAFAMYKAERETLARDEEINYYQEMIGRLWPDSDVNLLVRIQRMRDVADFEGADKVAGSVAMDSADGRLVEELADLFTGSPEKNMPGVIRTLEALRAKTPPTGEAALRQERIYRMLGFEPVARELMRRALTQNPSDVRLYGAVAKLPESDRLFQMGELSFAGSASFFLYAGRWAEEKGDLEKAEAYYQRALRLGGSAAAVERLVDIYVARSDFYKAEKALKGYLKKGDDSREYDAARNKLARLYLERKRPDDAYHLIKGIEGTWSGESMVLYARAAETLGEDTEAAMFHNMALERHPSSPAPVELALFHLRQGRRDEAASLLQDYKRYNPPGYYFHGVVEHFGQTGNAADVVKFISEVEDGKPEKNLFHAIWRELMNIQAYKAAALAVLPHMSGPLEETPYSYAGRYYQAMAREEPDKASAALGEAMKALEDDKLKWLYFGSWLVTRGYYAEALGVFDEYAQALQGWSGHAAVRMGGAWLLGGLGEEAKNAVEKRIAAPSTSRWHAALAGYYLGDVEEEKLLELAADLGSRVEVLYALGVDRQTKGQTEEAEKFFIMALETGDSQQMEYHLAMAAARRVGEKEGY